MFTGTHTPKLDDKGRLFLPAKFRDEMKEGLVITRGQDRSLEIRTAQAFEDFANRMRETTDPRKRAYNRMLFALAHETTPDRQGRISLTPELREYAGLDRECVVIGVRTKLEVWKPETWNEYNQAQEEAFANLSEEIFFD
jgi:MraZ protein